MSLPFGSLERAGQENSGWGTRSKRGRKHLCLLVPRLMAPQWAQQVGQASKESEISRAITANNIHIGRKREAQKEEKAIDFDWLRRYFCVVTSWVRKECVFCVCIHSNQRHVGWEAPVLVFSSPIFILCGPLCALMSVRVLLAVISRIIVVSAFLVAQCYRNAPYICSQPRFGGFASWLSMPSPHPATEYILHPSLV